MSCSRSTAILVLSRQNQTQLYFCGDHAEFSSWIMMKKLENCISQFFGKKFLRLIRTKEFQTNSSLTLKKNFMTLVMEVSSTSHLNNIVFSIFIVEIHTLVAICSKQVIERSYRNISYDKISK